MSMVERLARAMARETCDPFIMSEISIGLYEDKRWRDYEGRAIAALKALREPTPEMVTAGMKADGYCASRIGANCARDIWQAMIDATLAGRDKESG